MPSALAPYAGVVIHEGATPTRPAATTGHGAARSGRSIAIALLPLMAVVFVAYLVTGVAVSVLPVHVHERLRFGAFMVGVVAGTQVAATLISRLWAGRYADVRGSKRAVLAGVELRWRSWRGLSRIDLLHSIGVAAARRTIQGPRVMWQKR